MAEYIDREKMLKYLEENNTVDEWIVGQYNADWIYSFIENTPTADVEEVKHGEWKMEYYETRSTRGRLIRNKIFTCSNCNRINGRITTNYCSNCGAKMDLKGEIHNG